MRTVDPLPVQVASMGKETVLKLLRLVMGGTLLSRGRPVNDRVSRWIWSLLAKLPERGELTSEEIGVVRELGKKAVLVGMGLQRSEGWEEGLEEMEGMVGGGDEGGVVEDEGEIVENREKLDGESVVQAASNGDEVGESEAPPETSVSTEEEGMKPEDLEAIKARMLANISGSSTSVDAPPEDPIPEDPTPEEPSKEDVVQTQDRNTRATVNMVLTIAGEIYGQRDLLEFREVWGE